MSIRYDDTKIKEIARRLGVSEVTVLAYLRCNTPRPWAALEGTSVRRYIGTSVRLNRSSPPTRSEPRKRA